MKMMDLVPTPYTKEKAEELAKMMTKNDEDGWKWNAIHDPKGTGYSLVECRDDNGGFISYL